MRVRACTMMAGATLVATCAVSILLLLSCAVPAAAAGAHRQIEDDLPTDKATAVRMTTAGAATNASSSGDAATAATSSFSIIDTPVQAGTAPASSIAPGTSAKGRKQSLAASRAALKAARADRRIEDEPSDDSGEFPPKPITPAAVCGANSLVKTSYLSDCRIVSTYRRNRALNGAVVYVGSCSAFKIGDRFLGTAGHCVYNSTYGGHATTIDVYCTGANTCRANNALTTYATDWITTPGWTNSLSRGYDVAVVRTAKTLPGTTYAVGQAPANVNLVVEITGYPGQQSQYNCGSIYANGCIQYSSTGTLFTGTRGLFSSNTIDMCPGNSGGSVWNIAAKHVTGVVVAHTASPCSNFFAAQANNANVNANSCQHGGGGGVSLYCLMSKLPR